MRTVFSSLDLDDYEAEEEYKHGIHDALEERSTDDFVKWLRTPKGKQALKLIQQTIGEGSINCYRGIHLWYRTPPQYAGGPKGKRSSSPLLSAKEGSHIRLTRSIKYPLQHWTTDKKMAYEWAYERATGYQNAIILQADIPIDMIVYHYKHIDAGFSGYDYEKEVTVLHYKPLPNVKVVMNKKI